MITTELVTNAAAAMLIYPIAVDLANMSGHQSMNAMKAVAITVAIAASCSFITPIGYQTNTIVYGPGGYLFKDYIKVGLPLSFIVWGMASYLVPIFWPF